MTDTDDAILELLVNRVRVATVEQLSLLIGSTSTASWNRLKRMERLGWVVCRHGAANVLALSAPLVAWDPQDTEPNWPGIAHRLCQRWQHPPQRHRFAVATAAAGERWGGHGGRLSRPSELGHDLTLTGIYLHLLQTDPKRVKGWRGEAWLMIELGEGKGDKLPDAMLVARSGKTAIECGGRYDKHKLAAFHEYCRRRGLAYELW